MIVKNEEARLERCLASLAPYGFEIVVVDTGSVDGTKAAAAKYTDKIFDFAWCDDFSAARNFSLKQASNDWIFMMDADEWIEEADIGELDYFRKHMPDAMGAVNRHNKNGTPEAPGYSTDRTERFFNRRKYNYVGTIHEQLAPKYNFEPQCFLLKTSIGHDGYCMSDEERHKKAVRNITLLQKELEKNPEDPYTLYQLGKGYDIIPDRDAAIKYYMKALDKELDYSLAYVQSLFICCMQDMLNEGQKEEAHVLLKNKPEIGDSADYMYTKGCVLAANGYDEEALAAFRKAKTFDFARIEGANGALADRMIDKLTAGGESLPFSICIIAKNEEKNLDRFLTAIEAALNGLRCDIVFTDTGSKDETVNIAAAHGVEVHCFEWVNDFSAARNFSLSLAKNDFVLVLDCDEFISRFSFDGILEFMEQCPEKIGVITRTNHYISNGTDTVYTDSVERLFNRKLYRYEGTIHEQVCPLTPAAVPECVPVGITVDHSYILTEEEIKKKVERNNALLYEQLEKEPDNPYVYFQLGQSFNMLHDDEKANYYYGKGLELDVDPELEYVQMMVIEYGYTLLHLDRAAEALSYEGIYDEFAHSADFLVLMGLIYMQNGSYIKAMQQFLKAISTEEHHVEGSNSFIPRYNIGLINQMMGQTEDALKLYRSCGNFKPALDAIATIEGRS